MNDQQELIVAPTDQLVPQESLSTPTPAAMPPTETPTVTAEVEHGEGSNGVAPERWQARAGREGARRVHQLIQAGRLYEQEHGLKRGRQRLRQLIELGKLYEQEHGLRPVRARKHGQRLSRMGRHELMATLLECLLRIAKPSFRQELTQLVETLAQESNGHAA
jgi:truncated hemoglobin YjbI